MIVLQKPTALPVSVEDVQDELRLDGDEALLQRKIKDATARVENYLNQRLITQQIQETYELERPFGRGFLGAYGLYVEPPYVNTRTYYDTYDTSPLPQYVRRVKLDYGPVQSIDTVEVEVDEPENWVAFTSFTLENPDWLVITDYPNGFRIRTTYTVGYGDTADDIPPNILSAIFSTVGFLYNNRESGAQPDMSALDDMRTYQFS